MTTWLDVQLTIGAVLGIAAVIGLYLLGKKFLP